MKTLIALFALCAVLMLALVGCGPSRQERIEVALQYGFPEPVSDSIPDEYQTTDQVYRSIRLCRLNPELSEFIAPIYSKRDTLLYFGRKYHWAEIIGEPDWTREHYEAERSMTIR